MELYILKSAACLAIFYIFYKAFLEGESIHVFKRFYLLSSLLAAFCIPLITFTNYVEVIAPLRTVSMISSEVSSEISYAGASPTINYVSIALWSIYAIGVIIFGFRFFRNLFKLLQQVRTNPIYKDQGFLHVLLNSPVTPHTFFSYIFLNEKAYKDAQIPSEVLIHERAHAKQKHSIDIVLIEFLQIIFWFNPLLYFIKHSIKLNHEFLADKAVLKHGVPPSHYQNILLAFSSNASSPILANAINYSSTRLNAFGQVKKRFTVMKNQTSKKSIWIKSALLLPVVAIVLVSFSTSETITTIKKESASEVQNNHASPEQITAYNKMATYWNTYFEENPTDRTMPLTELSKLETIYRAMSIEQKELAEPFPECVPKKKANYTEEYLSGAARNNTKAFVLMITTNEIMLNGKSSSLETLSDDLDALTKDWEETDYTNAKPSILIASSSKIFVEKVNTAFNKSHYAKANDGLDLVINPLEPTDADVKITPKQLAEYNALAKKYNEMDKNDMVVYKKDIERLKYLYDMMSPAQRKNAESFPDLPVPPPAPDAPKIIKGVNDHKVNIPPPPPPPNTPKVIIGVNDDASNIPPPPPAPESPLDHIVSMAKKNATFYYEGEKISSDKAIAIIKNNENLNIQTARVNTKRPLVKISTAPITVDTFEGLTLTVVDVPFEGPSNDLSKPLDMLKFMIDRGAKVFLEGEVISEEKAIEYLKSQPSVRIKKVDTPHDVPSVILGEYGC